MTAFYDSARLRVEVGGSIEAALGMTDVDIINTLASNRQIIDELRRQRDDTEASIERVRAIHAPVEAINYGVRNRPAMTQVCTGCGQDNGNWQQWPCPTIRALDGRS